MPFRLVIVVSSNSINFINAHSLHQKPILILTMCIDKVKWITAHCGKPKWHSFTHGLTKCALENKLLNQNSWSWYHFSQEKLPHTLIQLLHPHTVGSMPFRCFLGHPCIVQQNKDIVKKHVPSLFSCREGNTCTCIWHLITKWREWKYVILHHKTTNNKARF